MSKVDLQEKTRVAWFKISTERPELRRVHGEDGWTVYENAVNKLTQEQIAQLFGVTQPTSHRWYKQYEGMKVA